MTESHEPPVRDDPALTPEQARDLLDAVPKRPRRRVELRDHLAAVAVIAFSLTAGVVALAGYPWWAIIPAIASLTTASVWLAHRKARANEPRFGRHTLASAVFAVWLFLPIWRGVTRGDTIPFPEVLVFAGLAPAAWLAFYLVLLIRR